MRWSVLLATCLAACFSPRPQAGAPCPDHVCPDGLVCSPASQTCELHSIDARLADGDIIDAPRLVDAAPRDSVPPDALVLPALIQQKQASAAAGPSLSLTLDAAPVNGDVLVMIGGCPAAPLMSVTGGGVTTWTVAASSTINVNVELWYGVTDGSSSTVTITLNGAVSPMTMMVSEWAGLSTMFTADGASFMDGTSSPATAGPVATTHAHDLLFFGVGDGFPNAFGAPAGFTALNGVSGQGTGVSQGGWYREVTATGTYSASVTETSHHWDAVLVSLRVAP